jgi:phosphate transport system permease protein
MSGKIQMAAGWLLLLVILIAALGYVAGRRRALASAEGRIRDLHSLPGSYGWNVALWALLPAALVLGIWASAAPFVFDRAVAPMIADQPGTLHCS